MAYFRVTFPGATALPKMHILEDHVISLIRLWWVGVGAMGEQGPKSIQAFFQ